MSQGALGGRARAERHSRLHVDLLGHRLRRHHDLCRHVSGHTPPMAAASLRPTMMKSPVPRWGLNTTRLQDCRVRHRGRFLPESRAGCMGISSLPSRPPASISPRASKSSSWSSSAAWATRSASILAAIFCSPSSRNCLRPIAEYRDGALLLPPDRAHAGASPGAVQLPGGPSSPKNHRGLSPKISLPNMWRPHQ